MWFVEILSLYLITLCTSVHHTCAQEELLTNLNHLTVKAHTISKCCLYTRGSNLYLSLVYAAICYHYSLNSRWQTGGRPKFLLNWNLENNRVEEIFFGFYSTFIL